MNRNRRFITLEWKSALKFAVLFSAGLLFVPRPSHAGSGASFLKLGVGARAAGLGSAYTAVADDVTALHWNPAGLSGMSRREVSAMHAELYAETRYDFIGYAHPTSILNMGISAVYLTQGSIDGRSVTGSKTDDFTANDLLVTLGASKLMAGNIGLGANVKLIQSQIAGSSARGAAFDLGTTFKPALPIGADQIKMGLAVQNIGPKMRFSNESYNLPLTAAVGVSYQPMRSLLVSADAKRQVYESKTLLSLGTEFSPLSLFSLRAGYISGAGNRSDVLERSNIQTQLSGLSGLGLGMGFKLGWGSVDYAFSPAGELGNVQRISLSLKF